jgi:F-box/leucine-rich repeat protein 2/20
VVRDAARTAVLTARCTLSSSDLCVALPSLANLTALSLHGCRSITDAALAQICPALTALAVLDVGGTRVGTDHAAFAALPPSLRVLLMSMCDRVSNPAVATIVERCRDLVELDLSNTRVGDAGVAKVAAVASLRSFSIARCKWVSSSGASSLAGCKNLAILDLTGTLSNDAAVADVARGCCASLRSISIAHCRNVTDASLTAIAEARPPHLFTLDASTTPVGATGVLALVGLTSLELLRLAWTNTTDKVVLQLAALPRLRALDLSWTRVSNGAVSRLAMACPWLRSVCLDGCANVSSDLRDQLR